MTARRGPARAGTERLEKPIQQGSGATQGQKVTQSTTPRRKTASRKFFNEPCEVNGIKFDSKAEAARYTGLYVAVKMGEIRDLEVHPKFPLVIHEQDCGHYEADFSYIVAATGERVVEDVKSPVTRKLAVYRLKVKQVWALYGLRVREVMA